MAKPKTLLEFPWQWGFDAAITGKPIEANPYADPRDHNKSVMWLAGYCAGARSELTGIQKRYLNSDCVSD